jgi:hypothetical protein
MLHPPAFSMFRFRITPISDYSYIFFETPTDVLQMLFVSFKNAGWHNLHKINSGYLLVHFNKTQNQSPLYSIYKLYIYNSIFLVRYLIIHTFLFIGQNRPSSPEVQKHLSSLHVTSAAHFLYLLQYFNPISY